MELLFDFSSSSFFLVLSLFLSLLYVCDLFATQLCIYKTAMTVSKALLVLNAREWLQIYRELDDG